MKTIGILGGSFNPIHIGHCILANFLKQTVDIDEVWLNVSPQNPLKDTLNSDYDNHRLEMARLAVKDCCGIKVTDIEFSLPRPSYTIATLRRLQSTYPDCRFKLIIGSDNWMVFDKWKNHEEIIYEFGVIVYPRPGYPINNNNCKNVTFVDAPQIEISSTFIRQGLKDQLDMRFFIPDDVNAYIKDNNLYQLLVLWHHYLTIAFCLSD